VGETRDDAGMYLRTTQRRNKDGSVVRYVQLAHNRRRGRSTTAEVLVNLGREDGLDMDGLRRLARSINRYLGEADGAGDAAGGEGLSVVASRSCGTVWLLDGLWRQLGIGEALRAALGSRRFATDIERVVFALVANRAVDPCSKLAATDWVGADVVVPGLDGMDDNHAYRAMDALLAADAAAGVQEAVFFAVANLLNLEVDLLFFDTTSTYFERDEEEPDGGFRRYGHSKDRRGDLPQVVIGLAVTREGIPVRVWVWPGNTTDAAVLPQVRDDLRDWRLGRVITVVDRGLSSDANLAYLARAGGHYIAGERMRDGSADAAAALGRAGRYRTVRDNLRVKEVALGGETGKRWIVCHNPEEAARDAARRQQTLATIGAELDRIAAARAADAKRKRRPSDEAHRRAECALRDHPTLGRYLRQLKGGRLVVDRAKVTAEKRLDGKFLLSTSDPQLSPEDVALGYKNLLEAERAFRDLKSTLELRPVFHRLEHRIRAHIVLCWLALLLVRVIERRSGLTWRRVATELDRVHQVTLAGPAGTFAQTTELSAAARSIYGALDVQPPPRVTTLSPR
jgi:Transposase DDE domain